MSAQNLVDAIATYNDHWLPKGKPRITADDLEIVTTTKDYRKHHTPDDGNSFLKSKKMADVRFGWVPVGMTPNFFKEHFTDIHRFKPILLLWAYNHKDELVFIEDKLCDGYHRAALAWHLGFEEYPTIIMRVKH